MTPVPADNSSERPAGCLSPNDKCLPANGQLVSNLNLVPIQTNGRALCVCPEYNTRGRVLVRVNSNGNPDPNGDRLGCVPIAVWLPTNPDNLAGAGVWVRDTTVGVTCRNPQECWDMCFYCDGSRRFNNNYRSAESQGTWRFGTLSGQCSVPSQPSNSPIDCSFVRTTVQERQPFAQACINFEGNAAPHRMSLPLNNGVWPFRPLTTSTSYQLPAGLTANQINQNQQPMISFTKSS